MSKDEVGLETFHFIQPRRSPAYDLFGSHHTHCKFLPAARAALESSGKAGFHELSLLKPAHPRSTTAPEKVVVAASPRQTPILVLPSLLMRGAGANSWRKVVMSKQSKPAQGKSEKGPWMMAGVVCGLVPSRTSQSIL